MKTRSLICVLVLATGAVASTAFVVPATGASRPGVLAGGVRLAAFASKPKPPRRAAGARSRRVAVPTPNDPLWAASWGLRAVGAPSVWRWGQGSPRVVVAVVDSGVDPSQPDLAGALVSGWNTLAGNADTADDLGHGTAVAGVIAARPNNRLGGSGYCGRCSIMPVKVLDAAGHGSSVTVASGITWAAAHGANVINLSLVLQSRDPAVSTAVAAAVAQGIVVVASAGNDGGADPNYPAADPGVIAVAANDAAGNLYPWSTRGDWVAVSAPGCNQSTAPGSAFTEFCGTSSATAAVSGVLALGLADSGATGAAIRAALPASASPGGPLPRLNGLGLIQTLVSRSSRS